MGYLHVDVHTAQSPKRPGAPCGDVADAYRSLEGTTLVVCDGLGSGPRAHLAAQFANARIMAKIRTGRSLRRAFEDIVDTMETNRGTEMPWAAFSLARIRPNGDLTVLSYEAPPPILTTTRQAIALEGRPIPRGQALVHEANGYLAAGEGVLLMSDGVTQAGMGTVHPEGWNTAGVCREVNRLIGRGAPPDEIVRSVHARARAEWGENGGDDITAALGRCREGLVVKLLTGPPSHKSKDREVVRQFLDTDACRIVCGATTAQIVAQETGKQVEVEQLAGSLLAPPRYRVEGIDLVTEGAVCLTQLVNVLGEEKPRFEEETGVSDLYDILTAADCVRIVVGIAANPASESIAFRQQGILSRRKAIPLLADKLREMGKLVDVQYA